MNHNDEMWKKGWDMIKYVDKSLVWALHPAPTPPHIGPHLVAC